MTLPIGGRLRRRPPLRRRGNLGLLPLHVALRQCPRLENDGAEFVEALAEVIEGGETGARKKPVRAGYRADMA
jgi:hypothetical protein